jgi:hypothetical protein
MKKINKETSELNDMTDKMDLKDIYTHDKANLHKGGMRIGG